jgi:hypothetical protein
MGWLNAPSHEVGPAYCSVQAGLMEGEKQGALMETTPRSARHAFRLVGKEPRMRFKHFAQFPVHRPDSIWDDDLGCGSIASLDCGNCQQHLVPYAARLNIKFGLD